MTPQNVAVSLLSTGLQGSAKEPRSAGTEERAGRPSESDFEGVYATDANENQAFSAPSSKKTSNTVSLPTQEIPVDSDSPNTYVVTPKQEPDALTRAAQRGASPAALVVAEQMSNAPQLPSLKISETTPGKTPDLPPPLTTGNIPAPVARPPQVDGGQTSGGILDGGESPAPKNGGVPLVAKDRGDALAAKENGVPFAAKDRGDALITKESSVTFAAKDRGEALAVKERSAAFAAKEGGKPLVTKTGGVVFATPNGNSSLTINDSGEARAAKDDGETHAAKEDKSGTRPAPASPVQRVRAEPLSQTPVKGPGIRPDAPAPEAEPRVSRETSDRPEEARSQTRPVVRMGDRSAATVLTAPLSAAPAFAQPKNFEMPTTIGELLGASGAEPEPLSRLDPAVATRVAAPRALSAAMGAVVVQVQEQGPALSNGRTIQIRLDPPDLGSFEIRLALSDDTARAVVATERSDTLELLIRHRGELISILRDAGFDVADAQFEMAGDGLSSDGDSEDTALAEAEPSAETFAASVDKSQVTGSKPAWGNGSDRLDVRI